MTSVPKPMLATIKALKIFINICFYGASNGDILCGVVEMLKKNIHCQCFLIYHRNLCVNLLLHL